MTIVHAIVLAVVEGLTEFLPVSSTGHLILVSNLLHLPQTDFLKTFEIAIQLAAIAAVVTIYRSSIAHDTKLLKNLMYSFVPTAIVGYLMYGFIKSFLLESVSVVLVALFIGGLVFIALELFISKKSTPSVRSLSHMKPFQAIAIGIFQSLSTIPGVSRAAATMFGGMIVGLDRQTSVEYSFLLAVPTMLAATVFDLLKSEINFNAQNLLLLGVGGLASFLTAYLVVIYFVKFIQKHTFIPFGVYRIILAATLALVLL